MDPTSRVPRREGGGYVEAIGDQLVLHVSGTPYDMGWQHGRLFRDLIRTWTSRKGRPEVLVPPRRLPWKRLTSGLREELRGLADGAGIAFDDAERLQAAFLPVLSGWSVDRRVAAAWGTATPGGKLYLATGRCFMTSDMAPFELRKGALLVVATPCDGLAHVYPSWAGFVGVSSGMNSEGIAVGATEAACQEKGRDGLPVAFLLKDVLRWSRRLDDALASIRKWPRSGAANILIGDGKTPEAVIVEATPSLCQVMRSEDAASVTPYHLPVRDVVRRTTQFVHPATAGQPKELRWDDWFLSQALIHYGGRLDAPQLMLILHERDALRQLASVCQAVYSASEGVVWLAQPREGHFDHPDGHGWRFQRYALADLVAERPSPIVTEEPPADRRQPIYGFTDPSRTLAPLRDPDASVNELLKPYNFPPDPFPWRLRLTEQAERFSVFRLSFPSPVRWPMTETNTVHADYYLPKEIRGRAPAVVVLHILDERFLLERTICGHFAANGLPALLLHMPYYGERRPHGMSLYQAFVGDPRRMIDAIRGTVLDVRRAACWLQERPEVDPSRLGIVGTSLGGITGALVIGVDPRFTRNVLVMAGGDPAAILWHAEETSGVRERLTELGYDLQRVREFARNTDALRFGKRVDPKHVLMINALTDQTVPRKCTEALWEAFGKPAIQWYPAGHYSISLFIPTILPSAVDFVKRRPAEAR